jgi:hypothetical protein
MDFFVGLIEWFACCFQGEKDWNLRRVLFITAIAIGGPLLAYLLYWLCR